MLKAKEDADPIFSILLKSKNKITNIGLRVIVTSFLIDDGRFKRGKVDNISENEVRIFVDGTENNVKDMLENLRAKLNNASEDSTLLIPRTIEIGEPRIVGTNPHPIELPRLTDFAQSLMLEQTGKGVCVMSNGFSMMSNGFNSLGNKFDNMANILEKYLEKQQ